LRQVVGATHPFDVFALGLCFSMCFCFKAGCKSNAPVSSLCCWGVVLRPVGLACSAFVVLFVWLLSCCACGAPVADPSRFANIPFAVPFLMVPFVWFYSSFRFVDPFVWFRSFSSVHLVPFVFGSISIAFVVPFMVPWAVPVVIPFVVSIVPPEVPVAVLQFAFMIDFVYTNRNLRSGSSVQPLHCSSTVFVMGRFWSSSHTASVAFFAGSKRLFLLSRLS